MWTPFNVTVRVANADLEIHHRAIYNILDIRHALDPTRTVHSISSLVQVLTDIYSDHNCHQDIELLKENYAGLTPESSWKQDYTAVAGITVPYDGHPFFVSEYRGPSAIQKRSFLTSLTNEYRVKEYELG